jgi:2-polyprenyl-6-methoxyphenol hydroxylase-like FAD-dependent oxidoreductase
MVLEKHADFLRDFRGDTIHPSTLELLNELGILEDFLTRPHQEARQLHGWVGNFDITIADFSHLPTRCKFIALMPQWDFLNFLVEHARTYPAFHLRMQAKVTKLLQEDGVVRGVHAETPEGPLEIRAPLVVGADGRHSTVRDEAGLQVENLGAPIDVLWMRLSRRPSDPGHTLGRFDRGVVLAMINRQDYWQLGYVIPKGGIEDIQKKGLPALREAVAAVAPFLRDRVSELKEWNDVKLLTVRVDRLKEWFKPGLLCLGDAAHAMSPVGGVGINLAIQDAVATANLLTTPLKENQLTVADLKKVQDRRTFPTVMTQRLQIFIQDRVLGAALRGGHYDRLPFVLRLWKWFPILRRIPARVVGLGFRPEKIE